MTIRVRLGKGQKDRYARLTPELLKLLREYWVEYRPQTWLFPGEAPDKPYDMATPGHILKKLCRIAGIQKRALGGHLYRCRDCGHEKNQYNSCRNRHCPKCQAMARSAWLAGREAELLPIPYFHLVFTIPHELGPLALQNKSVVYGIWQLSFSGQLKPFACTALFESLLDQRNEVAEGLPRMGNESHKPHFAKRPCIV